MKKDGNTNHSRSLRDSGGARVIVQQVFPQDPQLLNLTQYGIGQLLQGLFRLQGHRNPSMQGSHMYDIRVHGKFPKPEP